VFCLGLHDALSDNSPIDLSHQRDILYYYLSGMSKYLCQGRGERFDLVLPAVGRSQVASIRCASHVRALRRCVSLSPLYLDSRMNPLATRDRSKGPSFKRMYVHDCITDGRRKREEERREGLRWSTSLSFVDRPPACVGWQPIRRLSSAISSLLGPSIYGLLPLIVYLPFAYENVQLLIPHSLTILISFRADYKRIVPA